MKTSKKSSQNLTGRGSFLFKYCVYVDKNMVYCCFNPQRLNFFVAPVKDHDIKLGYRFEHNQTLLFTKFSSSMEKGFWAYPPEIEYDNKIKENLVKLLRLLS